MADLRVIDPPRPDQSVVEYLESLLARARQGEFSMIAVAYVCPDFTTGHGHSALGSNATMAGSVASLHHDIVRTMLDDMNAD